MGRPIANNYQTDKGILKYFPYEGAAVLVPQSMVSTADANGNKIVKAGTPFPADGATCKGYLLLDVNVTHGDAMGTIVFQGDIDTTKIDSSVTISSTSKAATPRVTFWS